MLTIRNRQNLKGKKVYIDNIRYWVEGVYEYPNDYQIHVRSSDKTKPDELFILLRGTMENISDNGILYKYYKLYNNNKPNGWVGLTKESMGDMGSVINAIEYVMEK